MCALVVGIYAYAAREGAVTQPSLNAAGSYYNLLVQGFRAGQLNLKKEVPAKLAEMADPYTPTPIRPNGVMDLSYYNGKLYLYFGATPAVLIFWPYVALTRHYLPSKDAAVFSCTVGFLVSLLLLYALWQRYFPEVSVGVVAAGTLALGLVPFIPPLLARCDVWEVAISCGYMLTMLSLAAIWKALHEPERRAGWLAAASLVYGLAVGARASLLLGAVILVVPVIQAWRESRGFWLSLVAMTVPITLIGLGLMLYNVRRFDDPLEFGIRYAVTLRSLLHEPLFRLCYFWRNLRIYFLEPAHWSGQFPFVNRITVPFLSAGDSFGVLANIPLTWMAFATPVALRGRIDPARSALRWFLMVVALLFGMCTLTLVFYYNTALRYQVDFLPALVLLAVIGIFSLERILACQPLWRRVVRWGWSVLLACSVAFSLLASFERWAESENDVGMQRELAGQLPEAIRHYEKALRLYPNLTDAHSNLGNAKVHLGKLQEAIGHYEQALRIKPEFSKAHNDFGIALARLGILPEAINHLEQALRIEPDFAEAHNNLGIVLKATGRLPEAMNHLEQALRINPDLAEAHNNLGIALKATGRLPEAISHWEQALRINPNLAEAHYNLGVALQQVGRVEDAIWHFEEALYLKPNYAEAQHNLDCVNADELGAATGGADD